MVAVARSATRELRSLRGLLLGVIAGAWAVAAWAEASGVAGRFHHHALHDSGIPVWEAAVAVFLTWQVMTAAMMLPTSLPFVILYARVARRAPRFRLTMAMLLVAYFAVWSAFSVVAYLGDTQVHAASDAWAWLGDRPQLIAAATLGFAAVYQLTPLKDACLRACRHPGAYLLRVYRRGPGAAWATGLRHGLFCLGCCWALMLVMFAVGVAHLAWMGVLGVVMLLEKTAPWGDRLVRPVACVLGGLAALALLSPGAVPGLSG